jgi:methyl-accepting chemotaxis protein
MTVTKRLILMATAALLGMISLCIIGLWEMDRIRESASYATVNSVPSYEVLDNAFQEFVTAQGYVNQYVLVSDKVGQAEMAHKFEGLWPKMLETLKKYEPLISDDSDKKLLEADRAGLTAFDEHRKKIFAAASADQNDEVKKLQLLSIVVADKVGEAFQAHRQYNHTLADAGDLEAHRLYQNAAFTFGGVTVFAIMACLFAAFLIARSLRKQLGGEPQYASDIARQIAAGDLSVAIDLQASDKSSLLATMKSMRDSLFSVVGTVRAGSEGVATASAQIASGNNDLSQRTEEQASALQQAAASMEQLVSTVKQNADNARQADQLAQSASAVAIKGGEVVAQVVETMKGINESSKKISDIISAIDGIAFQTNILALNAAVEAARAGEQGRGFAVVASEVRSLAGRSAEAAKEIKYLINASVERVEQGSQLVDQAGATMTEVVGSIRRVTDMMGEISAANAEQSQGVAQIGEAVTQMDTVTQQNAALVEEMAAAATSLQYQAQDLVGAVAIFKLGTHQASPVVTRSLAVHAPARPPMSKPTSTVRRALVNPAKQATPRITTSAAATGGDENWTSF